MAFKLSLRGRLTCFQVLSEKPDKTPPFKPFFWPLLIIHSVWRRRETLSEGLLSRPVRARFALRSRPERLLFISSVLQVVPVISDFPEHFLSAPSLEISPFIQDRPALTGGNPPLHETGTKE